MRRLRALVRGPPGADREAIEAALEESTHFTVAARVDSGLDVARVCDELKPDVLILDELLVGSDARRIASKLALERPLPTLLLVEGSGRETDDLAERLRLYELSKRSLHSSESIARSYTRTRLHLLATRAGEAKRTAPSHALAGMLDELREEEAHDPPLPSAPHRIARAPLDLILLVVGDVALEPLARLFGGLAGMRVPLLVAPDTAASPEVLDEAVQALPGAPQLLEAAAPLRSLSGLLVASANRRLLLGDDIVLVGPNLGGGLDIAELIMSLAGLNEAGLVAAVPPLAKVTRNAIASVHATGTHALMIGPADPLASHVPTATLEDFGQLLRASTPRRI